jgi:hypothetical protein
VRHDWILDSGLPTSDDSHKIWTVGISKDEFECAFLGLDVNKGPRPDGITPTILKRLASVVKVPLTFVFNLSLSAGVFPAIWKETFVVPIFKSGDNRDVSCYRGISILSAIPKIYEIMVYDIISPVVLPVISDTQHGFVKGLSIVSHLVQFTNGVIGKIKAGWQVDGVYTEFSKAFDRVLHGLLKFNLSILCGSSLLCWMRSYLTGQADMSNWRTICLSQFNVIPGLRKEVT